MKMNNGTFGSTRSREQNNNVWPTDANEHWYETWLRLWEENNNIGHKMSTCLLKLWQIQYLETAVTNQNYSTKQNGPLQFQGCFATNRPRCSRILRSHLKKSTENYIKLDFNLLFGKDVELSSQHNNGTQFVKEVLSRRFGHNKNEVTGTTKMCIIRNSVVCTFTLLYRHNKINGD
jgi:hypothetical protein